MVIFRKEKYSGVFCFYALIVVYLRVFFVYWDYGQEEIAVDEETTLR